MGGKKLAYKIVSTENKLFKLKYSFETRCLNYLLRIHKEELKREI